ncbi:MAG TPA: NCS2 family permease [Hyphomonadaceae bacterium]|jgi:AGZA family xanthine/uracil permease-like MFS transporter|nr:NCS2 family permease [Hyphomonadaceae bacterium]
MLERIFALSAHGTNVRTEALAGATTFLTMAYIIAVNPSILSAAGLPVPAVAAATCLSAGIASIMMGLFANYPLALAPGMGLNAYFTYSVVLGMGVPWQTALGCVFISGVAFFLLTLAGVRQMILRAMPKPLLAATAAGIGLFIAFIGLKNAGLIVTNPATFVTLGDLKTPTALLTLLGLGVIAGLQAWKVKGAMLIGIVVISIIGWFLGLSHWDGWTFGPAALSETAFKLDIPAAFNLGGSFGVALLEIIFVFLFVDLFDNVGTLAAVTKRAGLQTEDGSIPRLNRVLYTDSAATMIGSLAGTTTVTSYIESASGIAVGGRTGLTAVVTGLLFLLALFLAPLVGLVPAAATAPALILVGAMMMAPLAEVEWDSPLDALPAFLTVIMIPLTFSIANGLAFGITSYAVLKLVTGKAKASDWMLFVLGALFVARFAFLAAG